ncbi:MAG: protein kinase, partial [Myxococcota bacterium]
MSWFKKITSLFSSDTPSPANSTLKPPKGSTKPEPQTLAADLPKPPSVPGWSGPETREPESFVRVCQLMEWVSHPAFSEESYQDEAFQEHLDQLIEQREYPDLIEVLRRALIQLREHPPLLRRLALAYTEAYDNRSASALWRKLIELGHDQAEANFKLGELAERESALAEAAAYYQRALAFDVGTVNAWQRANRLKAHLPMPRQRAAVTMGGMTGGGIEGDPAAGVGVRPPDGFELQHPLGRGGFGTVYLARDVQLHRDVAIKFLHPHLTQDSRRVDAFFDEARLVSRLALPGVVRIYDLDPGDRVIIMEYLTRGTLRDRLASGRPLSLQAALRVA